MLKGTRNIESEGMISHRGAVLIRARATYCSNQRPDIRTQLTLKVSGKAKAGRLQITRCTYMYPQGNVPGKGVYGDATGFKIP
jgi:hypothetical protein